MLLFKPSSSKLQELSRLNSAPMRSRVYPLSIKTDIFGRKYRARETIIGRCEDSEAPLPDIQLSSSCHCKAVRFRLPLPALARQKTWHVPFKNDHCNMCQRNGYPMIFRD
ncbi:hypothetical protein BD289DRAFT_436935 [Coniella lustricola]|uniref:Uncharacterized protein n=1 Tax=Coniella lustricola TaxID=2025994 RepID=A0A2T3A4P0_9PEZI|nr:hypothetical protein BD289DRAFT_436935 [Coniella lustricola]